MAIEKAPATCLLLVSTISAMKDMFCLVELSVIVHQMEIGVESCPFVNVSFIIKINKSINQFHSAVKCIQPEDPKNGRAFYDTYTFGSIVSYQCKPGYQLYGPANRTCQADKSWSDNDPQCKSKLFLVN